MGAVLSVDLRGGFANQLFEWAISEVLRQQTGCRVVLDARAVDRPIDRGYQLGAVLGAGNYVTRQRRSSKWLWSMGYRVLPRGVYTRLSELARPHKASSCSLEELHRVRDRLLRGKPSSLGGYLQFPELLVPYQSQIAAVLSANLPPSDDNRPYSAIHVRRGDYVDNAIIAAKFGPLEVPYFVEALRNSGASKVVIVSDDGDWCGEILAPAIESELGICVEVARGGTFLEDFATLTRAETLVLSNSTFSWWAAFVGQQTSVIYPTPWMVSAGGELGLPGWTPLARDA